MTSLFRAHPKFCVHYEHWTNEPKPLWEPEVEPDKAAAHRLMDHLLITNNESHFCQLRRHCSHWVKWNQGAKKKKMGKHKKSDDQTGCEQTTWSVKLIWKRKKKGKGKIIITIHHILPASCLYFDLLHTHGFLCNDRLSPELLVHTWVAINQNANPLKAFKGALSRVRTPVTCLSFTSQFSSQQKLNPLFRKKPYV